jgi:hypothetical protein
LENNNLTGEISEEIGKLVNLVDLFFRIKSRNLGSNKLTGRIPSTVGFLKALMKLDLSNNSLTGPIPPEIGRLLNLDILYKLVYLGT